MPEKVVPRSRAIISLSSGLGVASVLGVASGCGVAFGVGVDFVSYVRDFLLRPESS